MARESFALSLLPMVARRPRAHIRSREWTGDLPGSSSRSAAGCSCS